MTNNLDNTEIQENLDEFNQNFNLELRESSFVEEQSHFLEMKKINFNSKINNIELEEML